MSLVVDVQSLEPGAIVELFELDATPVGGDISRFHAGTNALGVAVVWQGFTYDSLPVEASGFEVSTVGTQPHPTLRLANIDGLFSVELRAMEDLTGCRVTRRRTLVKYLDAVNFAGGINASADPSQHWPDDVFFVNRKVVENNTLIELELASPAEVQGAMLPAWQIIGNLCYWRQIGRYKDPDTCGWGGPALAGADFTHRAGTLGFAAGQVVSVIRVPLVVDAVAERAERLIINLTSPSGATLAEAQASVLVTEAAITPTLSVRDTAAAPGEVATFVLALDSPATDDIVLEVERILGADAGGDDISTPQVSFDNGATWQSMGALVVVPAGVANFLIRLQTVADAAVETWERLRLACSAQAAPSDIVGAGTIVEAPSGTCWLWVEDVVVADNAGSINVPVHVVGSYYGVDPGTTRRCDVTVYTADGQLAEAGVDYSFAGYDDDTPFLLADTGGVIPITIINRPANAGPRSFSVKVVPRSNPVGLRAVDAVGVVTVLDAVPDASAAPSVVAVGSPTVLEGQPLVFPVRLSHTPSVPVSVLVSKRSGAARVGDALYSLMDWTDYGYAAAASPDTWTPAADWQPVPADKRITIQEGALFAAVRCVVPAGTPPDAGYGVPIGARVISGDVRNVEVTATAAVVSAPAAPEIIALPAQTTEASGWATACIVLSRDAAGTVSVAYSTVGAGAYFDRNDLPVADPAQDDCSGKLRGCRLRFGRQPLRYGNFPGVRLVPR